MNRIHQKYPFYVSIATAIYFMLYFLAFHFQLRHVLVGVFIEILTIPAIIITPVLCVYALIQIFNQKKGNTYTVLSLMVSITTLAYLIYSFINH